MLEQGNNGGQGTRGMRSNGGVLPIDHSTPMVVSGSGVSYRAIEEEEEVERVYWCADLERLATILRENPALMSLLSGGGIYLFLEQFFKLWPDLRNRLQPAFAIISIGTMTIGFGFGVLSISLSKAHKIFEYFKWNPIRAASIFEHIKRGWMAFIEGMCAISPFVLTEIIIVYCSRPEHWDEQNQCKVSDEDFWRNFFPAPMAIGLFYMIWNSISLTRKKTWIEINKCIFITAHAVDIPLNALLYSRYIQALIEDLGLIVKQASLVTNISQSPNIAISETPAIVGASIALTIQVLKPQHKQKVLTLMAYTYGVVIMLKLISDIYIGSTAQQESNSPPALPWAILKAIGLGLGVIGGSVLTALWSRTFVKEWIVIRKYIPIIGSHRLRGEERDAIRESVRQQIIGELLPRDGEPSREDMPLSRNFPEMKQVVSNDINTRLMDSRAVLDERSSVSSVTEVQGGKAMLIAYQQQASSSAVASSAQPNLDNAELLRTSTNRSGKPSDCGIM